MEIDALLTKIKAASFENEDEVDEIVLEIEKAFDKPENLIQDNVSSSL